jgi:hypothetical protein
MIEAVLEKRTSSVGYATHDSRQARAARTEEVLRSTPAAKGH